MLISPKGIEKVRPRSVSACTRGSVGVLCYRSSSIYVSVLSKWSYSQHRQRARPHSLLSISFTFFPHVYALTCMQSYAEACEPNINGQVFSQLQPLKPLPSCEGILGLCRFSFLALILCPSLSFARGNSGPQQLWVFISTLASCQGSATCSQGCICYRRDCMMGKEVAAVGGEHCYTSPSAYSNLSLHRASGFEGLHMEYSTSLCRQRREVEGRRITTGRKIHLRAREAFILGAQDRPAHHLNALQILFLARQTHTTLPRKKRPVSFKYILVFLSPLPKKQKWQLWTV